MTLPNSATLTELLDNMSSYDSRTKARARSEITKAVDSARTLEAERDAWRDIAMSSARTIADLTMQLEVAQRQHGGPPIVAELSPLDRQVLQGLVEAVRLITPADLNLPTDLKITETEDEDRRVATDDMIARHAEKQGQTWADAWRYHEREGYDMSQATGQYDYLESDNDG